MRSSKALYLVLSIVTLAVVAAELGAYYYLEGANNGAPSNTSALCSYLSTASSDTKTIIVNTLINYGNGTMTWYNQTVVPSKWNAYALTMYVTKCNIQTEFYGQPYNEHLVTSINGVNQHGSLSWSIWTFCSAQHAWSFSQVGVDLIQLSNGETLAWSYAASSSANTSPPPVPGASTVGSCSGSA